MKQFIKILIIGWLGLSMMGCHGCKEPVMDDPCEGVTEVTADFKMEYGMGWNEDRRWLDADTVTPKDIRFWAIGEYDSVKWKIGLDPRVFTQRKFQLYFDSPTTLEVRMIGYRQPKLDCYPNDDGVDTVSKHLVVVQRWESLIPGDYEGHFLLEPDSTFVFSILKDSITTDIWVNEFPKGCFKNRDNGGLAWIGYRSFFTSDDGIGNCAMPYAWGFLSNDTLSVHFHYEMGATGYVEDTFIGIKK